MEQVVGMLTAVERMLVRLDHSQLKEFMELWPEGGGSSRECPPRQLPVLSWLEEIRFNAAPAADEVVSALHSSADGLFWGQTYSEEDFGAAFLRRYGWMELIGQRGPVPSDRLACGFLLLGPELEYPRHAHEAEEIYIPLSGAADWMCGEQGEWNRRQPMEVIHHESWMPHGTRTGQSPLLALYLWRGGNLTQKSRID